MSKENHIHKAGFVSLIGKPNAGKSTLINALIGNELNIVSPKAQTTRQRILAIDSAEDYQIVYSDTPGLIDPKYKLQELMMQGVKEALDDSDLLLYLIAVDDPQVNEAFAKKLNQLDRPLIILINKIDLGQQGEIEDLVEHAASVFPSKEILPISAIEKVNIDFIKDKIISLLPENPPYFPKEHLSDKPERFFVNEIIRKHILLQYEKEIPYAVEVVTQQFKEEDDRLFISCDIYVERPTQKGILIGHKGERLSRLGAAARKDLNAFFGQRTRLELFVKVRKNWRRNDNDLKNFGYS